MPAKFGKSRSRGNLFLKLFYYYSKVLGLGFFTLSENGRLTTSRKVQIVSIVWRLCYLAYYCSYFRPRGLDEVLHIDRMSIRIMRTLQASSIVALTLVCFYFQTIKQKQFVDILNRAIDIAYQIFPINKNSIIIGQQFSLVIVTRITCIISMIVAEFVSLKHATHKIDVWYIGQYVLRIYFCFGTLIVVDVLCLGYVAVADMYQYIGGKLTSLAKRAETLEGRSMTKFRQMQMLCDFSDELDKYAEIYSDIFKFAKEFHQLLQLYIFVMFCTNYLILIGNIHHTFLIYMGTGDIKWSLLIIGAIQALQTVFYILLLNRAVRSSKIPNCLNLDLIASDVDPRWDKSVDQFINQLRFQDLNLSVFGLFQLNNELLLYGFSATVSYLTILIQFQMLGYFKDNV